MTVVGTVVTLMCLLFLIPPGRVLSQTAGSGEIGKCLARLHKEKAGYEKYTRDKEKCRRMMENDVESKLDESNLRNQIDVDRGYIKAYEDNILDDEIYLRKHWGELSQSHRDWAEELEDEVK